MLKKTHLANVDIQKTEKHTVLYLQKKDPVNMTTSEVQQLNSSTTNVTQAIDQHAL